MFVIPVNHQDLLLEREGRYTVAERRLGKTAALVSSLEDANAALSDPFEIASNNTFDLLYNTISNFTKVDGEVHGALFTTLRTAVDRLRKKADKYLQAEPPADNELYKAELERYVQPLNMAAYLLSYAITEAEKAEIETAKAKTRTKKGEKKDKLASDGWTGQKDKMLVSIIMLLDLDLARFWSLSHPENEFCLLWTKIAGAMMSNPANLKHASLKANLFLLFAKLVQKYDQSISVAHMINEQLHHHPHVAKAFPPMLEDIANKHGNSKFVGDVVRDMGNADVIALGKDTSAAKNMSLFLTQLAAVLPRVVLQNVSMFMPHLDAELYTIRNGVIEAMGELVLNAFEGEDVKEDGHQTRNKLLECLQERFLDSNAYCRSKTMDTWARLVQERKVPMNFMNAITSLTVSRLKDKTVAVRKNALRLLTTILKHNAFCPTLKLSELKRRLAAVDARLAEAYSAIVGPTEQQKQQQQQQQQASGEAKENAGEEDVDKENAPSSEAGVLAPPTPPSAPPAPSSDQADKVAQDLLEQAFYKQTIEFAETLDEATKIMCTLLSSKNKTDLQEVIKFFTTAKEYYLESADVGFRKMLHLLWNEEKSVRDAVVKAYKETYLEVKIPANEPKPQRYACFRMAYNLIDLTEDASLSELISLERLIGEFLEEDMIHDGVVDALWNIFGGKGVNGTSRPQESRGAIVLLSMVAAAKPDTVRDHIDTLARIGLLDRTRWNMDPIFAKFVCLTLQKMGGTDQSKYPSDHAVFEKLTDLLLSPSGVASNWCQSAEQVVNTIYILCDEPHLVMEPVIKAMTNSTVQLSSLSSSASSAGAAALSADVGDDEDEEEEEGAQPMDIDAGAGAAPAGVSVDSLSRLLFLVGHVALKELLQVEHVRTAQKQKRSIAGRKAAEDDKAANRDAMEDEMGMDEQNAAIEEEYLNVVMDKHIVCSNLLGEFGPILKTVLLNREGRYSHRMLQVTACMALSKFMAVSLSFCKANLQLLFTVLEHQADEAIRSNIMIALGDLSYRFPNLIEPWNASIYKHLQDPSAHVRKTTLMVLSHLILNGVIKIKNNGGLLALAVIDEDPRINEFSRQFFIKLSHTDKGIYNALPDIVSYLSSHQPRLDEDAFRQITQFVFGFIQTDRETESLVEKLCHRFTTTTKVEQWRDIACCLSMLDLSKERAMKKLYACANTYKEICHDKAIYLHFVEMINKSKKGVSKVAQPAIEVQKIIDECFAKHHPNQPLPSGEAAPKKRGAKKADKTVKRKRGGVKVEHDDDDDDEDDDSSSLDMEDEDDEEAPVSQSAPVEGSEMVEEEVEVEEAPVKKTAAKKSAPAKRKAPAPKPKKKAPAARPRRTGRAAAAKYVEDDDDEDEDSAMSFSDEEE